jgi:hypothetical protein
VDLLSIRRKNISIWYNAFFVTKREQEFAETVAISKNPFCICEADILLSQTYCYRMLAHSHSAMSLYNWANLSQSAISLHQLFTSCPHLPANGHSLASCYFFKNILILSIYLELVVLFSRHSNCDIIPNLSINMETYSHLVSSQIPHIFIAFVNMVHKQIYTVKQWLL